MGDKRKMKLSGELDYRIRYDVEHDLFHAQNVFNDEYIKPTFIEYVQKLEKENAELKEQLESERYLPAVAYMQGAEKQKKKDEEELKKWKDEWQEQVQKAIDEGYARTLQSIQLLKAKEHIRTLISCLIDWVQEGDKDYCYISDAEQFLEDLEK
jgi:hypothetical protein